MTTKIPHPSLTNEQVWVRSENAKTSHAMYLTAVNGKRFDVEVDQRDGQFAFNVLRHHHPGLANVVTGMPDVDPFYKDENLPAFHIFVDLLWDEDLCDIPTVGAAWKLATDHLIE